MDNKLVRKVVPAVQRGPHGDFEEDFLDYFFNRKYHRYCNFEAGHDDVDYWTILDQLNSTDDDPWEAFKNIHPQDFDDLDEVDDSDEFSYISSLDNDHARIAIGGYTYHGYRWKLLTEADLLIEGVDY